MKRHPIAALLLACTSQAPWAAGAPGATGWWPDELFIQYGVAERARTTTLGATWHWRWQRPWAGGTLGGYWEASFGRWASELDDGQRARAWVTQLGVTPVLRWTPQASPWIFEAGIGANLLMPIYRSKDKRFSTTFNFGDHLALGRRFSGDCDHELAVRIQHFSNANIRKPNPGEDFLQLRYSRTL